MRCIYKLDRVWVAVIRADAIAYCNTNSHNLTPDATCHSYFGSSSF
ncbi:MAG TPA: hypothetical protein V6D43_04850 [Candidatus Sericytochromatia bacterium]